MTFLKRHLGAVSSVILCIGLAAVVLRIVDTTGRVSASADTPTGFTMVQNQVFTPSDGHGAQLHATVVRYQNGDGAFKEVTTQLTPEGGTRTRTLVSELGRGTFHVDEDQGLLHFASPANGHSGSGFISESWLRNSPNFVGEGEVLGFKTYILRTEAGNGNGYFEDHHAPALLGLPIKMVRVWSLGTMVTEATSVLVGDPDPTAVSSIPDYKVDYRVFREKIADIQEVDGKEHVVSAMQAQLAASEALELSR